MYDKVSQTFLTNQGTGEFETPIYEYLSGIPPFTFNSNGNPLVDYTISGNTAQTGTPTPNNPIIPEGRGDLETSGAKAGQYKIPISSANTTTPIYLGEVQTTRKIKKFVLTGEENWSKDSNKDGIDDYFYTDIILGMLPSITPISSHFVSGKRDVVDSVWATGTTANPRVVLEISKSYTGITSADDKNVRLAKFKSYLAAQYAAGTPVTVWYVLANEEIGIVNEPLMKIGDYADTVSKAQAGVEIPTINGSNTLTVDTTLQPSEVSIVYKK